MGRQQDCDYELCSEARIKLEFECKRLGTALRPSLIRKARFQRGNLKGVKH